MIVSHYVYIYFEIVEFSFEKDCCCFFKQFIQLHLRNLILFFSMSNVLVRKENCQFHYYVTWMMMINTFNVFRMTILDFVWSINILNDLRLYLNWKNHFFGQFTNSFYKNCNWVTPEIKQDKHIIIIIIIIIDWKNDYVIFLSVCQCLFYCYWSSSNPSLFAKDFRNQTTTKWWQ